MESSHNGNKTILVVEDNDFVRAMTTSILQTSGYKVVNAVHGREAFAICMHREEPIDLILTDVLMPHMTGPELIERLGNVRNDFKVLFMSGFMDDATLKRMMLSSREVNFIGKPFDVPDLLNKVSDILAMNSMGSDAAAGI